MNKKITIFFFFLGIVFNVNAQIVISQYYEGAGTNKWIEITNMGSTSINLASPQLKLGIWSATGSAGNITFFGAPTNTMNLTGTMPAGQSFLIGRYAILSSRPDR